MVSPVKLRHWHGGGDKTYPSGGVIWYFVVFTVPSSCQGLHHWCTGGGITAASGTPSLHSSYLTYPGMPVHVLALQVPLVECYTSPKQLPSHMGYWKGLAWASAHSFPQCVALQKPWEPVVFSSTQPLTKAWHGIILHRGWAGGDKRREEGTVSW